jgi:hypothetical protein
VLPRAANTGANADRLGHRAAAAKPRIRRAANAAARYLEALTFERFFTAAQCTAKAFATAFV